MQMCVEAFFRLYFNATHVEIFNYNPCAQFHYAQNKFHQNTDCANTDQPNVWLSKCQIDCFFILLRLYSTSAEGL